MDHIDQLFWLSRLFCGISFVWYNFIGLRYIETVLSSVKLSGRAKLAFSVFNTLLYLGLSSLGLRVHVVYLCGLATLMIEFTSIYKIKLRRMIYVACTFMFNIAAMRNLVLSFVALVTVRPINQISGNDALYNLALTVSFLFLDIIMLLFIREKFVTFEDLTIFAEAKIQETYAAILSTLIFAYIMLFSGTHSYNVKGIDLTILNLFTPITLAALYYVSFSYGVKMSKMIALERRSRALESELKETMESKLELENIAYIDPLTEAYSRRYCIERVDQFLAEKVMFCLCFIDVDKLKVVNDTHGHAAGDIYLQLIAETLRDILRRNDIIARMGGDEFVILLPDCPQDAAVQRMRIAHRQICALKRERGLVYDACISYGIIEVDSANQLGVDELLSQADKLMYEFKMTQKIAQKMR